MRWWWLLAALVLSGCGSLRQPPLHKFAADEAPSSRPSGGIDPASEQRADVIYLGLTNKTVPQTHPAWRLIATLQQGGARVALGWTDLPATEQTLLDQWQRQELSAQQLIDQLGAPERGEWMRRALRPELLQLALGSPRELLSKVRSGADLTTAERAQLPRGYRPRPEALDTFTDRVSTSPRLRRYNLEQLYRTHLLAEQMIAEHIVQFMMDHPGVKLLVFLPDDAMINAREIAEYVAQKTSLRQMLLDRVGGSDGERPQLLARTAARPFKVVDGPPKARRHDRRLATPRLRA
ncbi:MAG: ChaN family lipoprotein [Chthoniobacterales bacterium]